MDWTDLFSFPLSVMLAVAFCVGILIIDKKDGKVLRALRSRTFSVIFFFLTAILTAIEGTWKPGLPHNPFFLAVLFLLMTSTAIYTMSCIRRKTGLTNVLTHSGLLLVLVGGFFGTPDFTSASMKVGKESGTEQGISYAVSPEGMTVPLDFSISLKELKVDYYDDGKSPKQFTSILDVDGIEKTTSVNHPCRNKGWLIYQANYDRDGGNFTVLALVRDPWLPLVFLGMAVLALGAVLELKRTWNSRAILPVILVLAVAFTVISLARIKLGTLAPALRSLWFVPHLIIYMAAYSVLAISLVCGLIGLSGKEKASGLAGKLLNTASSLLLLGMLCGAVWAKYAWGDYWTWDAKECWAAVTWMLTLAGTHLPDKKKNNKLVIIIFAAFLAMQMTWYGVNHLPAARESMHTYNTK